MGEATVSASTWRMVERGRVVLFTTGKYEGRLAAIAEIIDHKRVLVDGPSEDASLLVPRHSASLTHVTLTEIVIPKVALAAGSGSIKKSWQKADVEGKWAASAWAQSRDKSKRRRELSDFERFKVMRLRKQARFEQRKSQAKARSSA